MEKKPKNTWKFDYFDKYRVTSTIDSATESEDADERIVYMKDLEKRKEAYGICKECNEPATGQFWCQPCNAKRSKDNFKNWTSGNKNIDEFIQQSQLNAVSSESYLEWIPFEKFQNITFIAEGGFGKIYLAEWTEGFIWYWDIENQNWYRYYEEHDKYALKRLNNSSDICSIFLDEIKSHLQIDIQNVIRCYGITQDPNTRDYMMVLTYCQGGNLRDSYSCHGYINYGSKIDKLQQIATGLFDIHNAGKVHKDFHSGCRPKISKDVPKLLADLIIKCWDAEIENRPTANVLYQLLKKWNDEIKSSDDDSDDSDDNEDNEDSKYNEDSENSKDGEDNEDSEDREDVKNSQNSEIYSQVKECDEIRRKKFESESNKNKSINIRTHPQAIYTSRPLNFKNLPKPANSSDLSSFQFNSDANYAIQSTLTNPISECLDIQLSELELNKFWQNDDDN
ncbi:kinase-like domain-containing protein [Rhizophagus clarus]|uniref:Kinase-like domain-containing protein n=1 Tax=Rhizophagus clarus TaxID=94130 RepID=A0A8H3QZ26_9GLOM|nr:kinase-like domain-containing protein [Rhizophagus clarus]